MFINKRIEVAPLPLEFGPFGFRVHLSLLAKEHRQ
jgi:hypothetical protein